MHQFNLLLFIKIAYIVWHQQQKLKRLVGKRHEASTRRQTGSKEQIELIGKLYACFLTRRVRMLKAPAKLQALVHDISVGSSRSYANRFYPPVVVPTPGPWLNFQASVYDIFYDIFWGKDVGKSSRQTWSVAREIIDWNGATYVGRTSSYFSLPTLPVTDHYVC